MRNHMDLDLLEESQRFPRRRVIDVGVHQPEFRLEDTSALHEGRE